MGPGLDCLDQEVPVVSRKDVFDRSGSEFPGELLGRRVAGYKMVDSVQGLPPVIDLGLGLLLVASKGCDDLVPCSLVHGLVLPGTGITPAGFRDLRGYRIYKPFRRCRNGPSIGNGPITMWGFGTHVKCFS